MNTPRIPNTTVQKLTTTKYVVVFKNGYYVKPPIEAEEAYRRIEAIISSFSPDDVRLIKEWDGSVRLNYLHGKSINPEITQEMRDNWTEQVQVAYPEYNIDSGWDTEIDGLSGYSVRIYLVVLEH